MHRIRCTVVTLALALSLGLHWAALQTVAWTRMFVGFSQEMSLGQAVAQTFDGQHPCSLCLAIRHARHSSEPSSPLVSQVELRLECDLPSEASVLILPLPTPPSVAWRFHLPSRNDDPPTPPPRAFHVA